MPHATALQTRPAHHFGAARDHALTADAAALHGAATGPRPVTHDQPAHFHCGRRFTADGLPRADYGTVYARPARDGLTSYSYDREGNQLARRCVAPEGQYLECQGRGFLIVEAA